MKIRKKPLVLAFAAATLNSPPTIVAQERESRLLEEVVVTATRREQGLQDVPLSVSAISADDMSVMGISSFVDIKPGTIPGVNFQPFSGSEGMMMAQVRGVAISDGTQGTFEMPVPIYIDGVFLGRTQGAGLELIDPERIEIMKGPQGTLFGRNGEGGVVQFVSRKPTGEFGVRASASFGDYSAQRYKAAIDLPKVAGFSATISGISSEHDPYTEQAKATGTGTIQAGNGSFVQIPYTPPKPQDGYNLLDMTGYRIALRWQSPNENFTADYTYDDTDQDDSQAYLTWVPVDTIAPPNAAVAPSNDYQDKTFERGFNRLFENYAKGHALTLEWSLSDDITLKSITSYREAGREGSSNLGAALPAGGTVGLYAAAYEILDAEQESQELQFIGTWDRFDLTAGAIYYHEEVDDVRISQLSGPIAPLGFPTDPAIVGDNRQNAETDSWGVYAQINYRPAVLDDRLELIAGARYSDDSKDAKRFYSLTAGGPVDLRADFDEQRVDPAFTVRYQLTDDMSTYLRYATGYRAGGANVRSSIFSSFDEEETEAWELGLKSRLLDGRVQLNTALYYNTIKGEQRSVQEAPTTNPSLTNTVNADEDKDVWGVELETVFAFTDSLLAGVNLAYLDADDTVDIVNPFDPRVVNRFWSIQTPEWTGSVYLDYDQPLPLGSLRARASYAWTDDYWATPGGINIVILGPNYERPAQDSEQLDARLGWADIPLAGGAFEVALWGKNLTDDAGRIYSFDGCASGGGFCAFRAYPRTYGVEFKYEY